MKIAIDCRYIGKSGIGTYIENIVDDLGKNHPENDYLLIVGKDNNIDINACVIKTNVKPFSLGELFRFPVDDINKCDVFFSPYINIPGKIKIPIYSTIHDVVFYDVDGMVSPIGKCLRSFFFRRAIKKSKKIFTVSEFSKERIQYHFPSKKDFVVVYNGVSKTVRNFKRVATVKKDYIVYVGNIKKHKGLNTLIEAYQDAKNKGLHSKLLIVGNKENFRTSDTEVTKVLSQSDDITFTGWVPDSELARIIAEAKVLVQPSFYEGFGIPPLEALYLGTNVILSDIPVFKELYGDFPVTFFKVGNHYDLCEKLMEPFATSFDFSYVRKQIDMKYNYVRVTNLILRTIEKG